MVIWPEAKENKVTLAISMAPSTLAVSNVFGTILLSIVLLVALMVIISFVFSKPRSPRKTDGSSALFTVVPSVSGNPVASAVVAAAAASKKKEDSCCHSDAHRDTHGGKCCSEEAHECGCENTEKEKERGISSFGATTKKTSAGSRRIW